MTVLTAPHRSRLRFGPQAGLVAAPRGVAFAVLMAAGIGLLIMIVAAVFLMALGAAILIVGHGGPHEERVLLGFLAIGSGAGPDPVRAAGYAAGHQRAGPADQAADRGLVRRAHRRVVCAPARRKSHLYRTA